MDRLASVLLLSRDDPELWPAVSLFISAYDEEKAIVARLENLARLRYPRERLQILLGSDGSSDRTAELARSVGLKGLGCMSPITQ